MNPSDAFRKFGKACMSAPPDASLTVGLIWDERKRWRVMMNVHTSFLNLGPKEARALADIYDKHHQSPEWRGKVTGVEWVASELRKLAAEADKQNLAGVVPPEMLGHISTQGHS